MRTQISHIFKQRKKQTILHIKKNTHTHIYIFNNNNNTLLSMDLDRMCAERYRIYSRNRAKPRIGHFKDIYPKKTKIQKKTSN